MFTELLDLASRAMGGTVVFANDEFFADRENLINPHRPTFTLATFGHKGQIYDGWETRRRREPGHDHAIVRLGVPGVLRNIIVDTAFFTGNYPTEASVDGCFLPDYPSAEDLEKATWFPLIPRSPLEGDTENSFPVPSERLVTHVRLNIFPDGGVARLRVHGTPVIDPSLVPDVFDLAAAEHGAAVTDCSDRFYGSPNQLLLPGLAQTMGDGWETRRRRDDGNDWVEIKLAAPGLPQLIELDTSHFKGNCPGTAKVSALDGPVLLEPVRLQPDTRHRFRVSSERPVDAVRLDIFPDGGMARFRLYGTLPPESRAGLTARWNALQED
ncbi:allantoicase [Actinocorallia sp. A-T 12471]|uniref:allantoicase n=1 Tax=Actinocorallia sp. A-T 12471 TaxID=3089813 RepID=UPI0029CFCC99|nr:allantoicase [Actinocorallia sp. A-T 12471]MDX6743552.1 allantoicase [Actinocorallia sp. A-T 12471]